MSTRPGQHQDDEDDIFAGFTSTLESGFPGEAIKVVIQSIPLIDNSVGALSPPLHRLGEGGVRWIVPAAVAAVLSMGGARATAAQTARDVLRAQTRDRLFALVRTYGASQHFKVYRHDDDPFTIEAVFDKDLRYAPRFETWISVTRQQTIQFRVYTQWYEGYLNLDRAQDPDGFMQKLLRLSDQGFFFWAADEDKDVFAGFTFTLESGFPEEAIKVVIRSIPLLDQVIGELEPIAGR